MKKSERHRMKLLKGGSTMPVPPTYHIPNLVGWIGGASVGYCLCDFYNVACPNNVCCFVQCPVTMCTEGSLDPHPPTTN